MVAPPQYMQVVHHPALIQDLYPSHSSGKKNTCVEIAVSLILLKHICRCSGRVTNPITSQHVQQVDGGGRYIPPRGYNSVVYQPSKTV